MTAAAQCEPHKPICRAPWAWALLHLLLQAAPAQAAVDAGPGSVQLVGLDVPQGHSNPRPRGLDQLIYEVRRRTSIAMAMQVRRLDLTAPGPATSADLPISPLLVWQGDAAFPPLPENAVARLGGLIASGATLLVDVSDGVPDGPFERAVTRELRRALPYATLAPIPTSHVLYKSFYLVDRHSGRTGARAALWGMQVDGRMAVVLSANDLLGSMAKTPLGAWEYAVQDGERAREMALRLAINWVMYSLCLDYKDDQVHIPFILKRRR